MAAFVLHGRVAVIASAAALVVLGGCVVPKSQFAELQILNRNLSEQNRAQVTEIENLRVHSRQTEDQLRQAEDRLAVLEKRLNLDNRQLADYGQERDELHRQFVDAVNGRPWISPETQSRLAEFSRRHPELKFDPSLGVAKLDSDILFDSGTDELKPGAEKLLRQLSNLLKQPEVNDTRVVVVGHTDDRRVAGAFERDAPASNLDLSTARALAVANRLRGLGLKPDRLAVSGLGDHEPLVANSLPRDRYKNRRVEIFVVAPNVPLVGWTETTPNVYR